MTQLGKYDILEELGRGGFGIVYKARDLSLDRVVALKVLHPQLTVDPRFVENFKREARHMAKVEHPNVVSVYEISEVAGRLLIAMRYLPGGSLADRIAEGPLKEEETLKIVSEAAAGLAAGHEKGIIHRDVKPANIIFDDKGHAVMTDFGVARAVHVSSMGTTAVSGGMVGTPYYRPPELWRGKPKPSPATDVYSLGCVLYEMLTGEVLFTGETPDQVMTSHVLDDTQILMRSRHHKVPTSLRPALEKALAKEPSQRYQSMAAFVGALKRLQRTQKLSQKPTPVKVADRSEEQRSALPSSTPGPKSSRESQASRPQKGKSPSGNEATVPTKKKKPAWAPWMIVGVLVTVVVCIVGFVSLIRFFSGGSAEPELTEVAQTTQTSEKVDAAKAEVTPKQTTQPAFTETTNPTRTLIVTPTPTKAFGKGSTRINDIDDSDLVYVPKGNFVSGYDNDKQTLYVDEFWIHKYEVTHQQYLMCVDDGVCSASSASYQYDYPINFVEWYQAEAYCEWAGGRLPTHIEWEKAARGTDARPYPWGDSEPSCYFTNYVGCSGGPSQVGSHPAGASPYGALDMAGNVAEWVVHKDYISDSYKVYKGASWDRSDYYLHVSNIYFQLRGSTNATTGFRCVFD